MATETGKLTADLLTKLPREFPRLRLWRQNTGRGVPLELVRRAVAMIRRGMVEQGIALLEKYSLSYGVVGGADLSGILGPDGRRVEAEVKVGSDRLSPNQLAFKRMIDEEGGLFLECRNLDEVIEELRKI